MTDQHAARLPTAWKSRAMAARLKRRYRSERVFHLLGLGAIVLSAAILAFLLFTMLGGGVRGFLRTEIAVPIDFPALAANADPATVDVESLTARAVTTAFGARGAVAIAENGWLSVRDALRADPGLISRAASIALPASYPFTLATREQGDPAMRELYRDIAARTAVTTRFDAAFLTGSDATDPMRVGIWGALKGSLLTMLVTIVLAFPIGVLSAIYLEEYAARNRWTDLIEVSINNLAAVPSIIFGLLGLAVFLNTLHLPRSAPLVGGLTLALMTFPVIVIAGRNAIKSVPPSIRDAALGIGASRVQVVFHHVLPLALPGILTGTIIGMARALGETAPLLLIGMRAFMVTPPGGIFDPSSVLPVQIYLWSDEVNQAFIEKTSAAIIILLIFLLTMNGLAIYLRNRFETRW